MFITVPASKQIVLIANQQGAIVNAYAADDPEIPDINGQPAQPTEFQFCRDFVRRMLLNDQSWGASMEKLYMAMDLRGLFAGGAPGDAVEVTKDQHAALLEIMKKPSQSYVTCVAVLLGDFFRAIEKPTTERPHIKLEAVSD